MEGGTGYQLGSSLQNEPSEREVKLLLLLANLKPLMHEHEM